MKTTYSLVVVLAMIIMILFSSCDKSNNDYECSLVYDTYKMQHYEIDSSLLPTLDVIIAKEETNKDKGFNPFVFMGVSSCLNFTSDSTSLVLVGIGIQRYNIFINRVYCISNSKHDSFFKHKNFVFCFSHSKYYDAICSPTNDFINLNVSYSDWSTCGERESYYPVEPNEWIVSFEKDSIMIDYFYSIEAGVIEFDTVLTKVNPGNASNELVE